MKRNIPTPTKMKSMLEDFYNAHPEQLTKILPEAMRMNPSVIVERNGRPVSVDPVSFLLQNRNIFYTGQVDEVTAELATTQLLFLDADNPELDITMNIASPGGVVYYGMSVIDTMNTIAANVATLGHGLQMSMGAMTLINGEPGMRFALPNSRIMIHQPSGGNQGTASIMAESQNEIDFLKAKLLSDIVRLAGVSLEHAYWMCEQNYYMDARKALMMGSKGIIDGILVDRYVVKPEEDDEKVLKPQTESTIIRRENIHELEKYTPDVTGIYDFIKKCDSNPEFKAEVTAKASKEIKKAK